jgi:hypothetical protein
MQAIQATQATERLTMLTRDMERMKRAMEHAEVMMGNAGLGPSTRQAYKRSMIGLCKRIVRLEREIGGTS